MEGQRLQRRGAGSRQLRTAREECRVHSEDVDALVRRTTPLRAPVARAGLRLLSFSDSPSEDSPCHQRSATLDR